MKRLHNINRRLTCAVVFPTYMREDVLCQTINQVLDQSVTPDEFIIIDQTETHKPETINFLQNIVLTGKLRWIRHNPPGTSGARNRGLKEAKSDILISIDDDILTHNDFVKKHLENYTDDSIQAVCGQVRHQDGNVINEIKDDIDWTDPVDVSYKFPRNYGKRVDTPGVISGGNFSVRRTAMLGIGGFNEYVPTNGEDGDIGLRLSENRCRIVFDPEPWIIHLSCPTGGRKFKGHDLEERKKQAAGYAYLAFRYIPHGKNKWVSIQYFIWLLWLTFRVSVFNKYNILYPLNLPESWGVFFKAVYYAYHCAKLRDPLVTIELE